MKKLREPATVVLHHQDLLRILSEAICDFIGPFDGQEVWRITKLPRARGWRLELMPKLPKPAVIRPAQRVEKPKIAAVPVEKAAHH